MLTYALIATAAAVSVAQASGIGSPYAAAKSAGHDVQILDSSKSDRKWMVFPDQVRDHQGHRSGTPASQKLWS